MTGRERVLRALRFEKCDRVPRDLWELPGARKRHGEAIPDLLRRFPVDIVRPPIDRPSLPHMKGDPAAVGIFVDEWGCEFLNVQEGVIGEVKNPVVKDWRDLDRVRPPHELIGKGLEKVNEFCAACREFVLAGWNNPFERLQFLRGSENLYGDLGDPPAEFFALRDRLHQHFLAELDGLCRTNVDGITFADDWGSQKTLLIRPDQWRELFKPLYKDYADVIHQAGKFAFMHSDGHIFDIYQDLIEIGVDAINSQIFCMDIEEIGKRFCGKITFWGELSRQTIMPHGTEADVRNAVRRVWKNLSHHGGGVIAQFEYGLDTRPENAVAAFEEWGKMTAPR